MIICKKCGNQNADGAMFCGRCGAKLAPGGGARKSGGKRAVIAVILLLCAALIIGGAAWCAVSFTPYNRQIRLGYQLLEQQNYEEAVLTFDKAIEIDEKRPEGYIGKAKTYAYDNSIQDGKAKKIIGVLNEGYQNSQSLKVLSAMKTLSEELHNAGLDSDADDLLQAYEKIKNGESLATYHWKLEPYLAAEDINAVAYGRPDEYPKYNYFENLSRRHIYDRFSLIRQNGKWGLIDYDGSFLAEPVYEYIKAGYDRELVLSTDSSLQDCYTLNDAYRVVRISNFTDIIGTYGDDSLAWDEETNCLVGITSDLVDNNMQLSDFDGVVAVQKCLQMENGATFDNQSSYALVADGQLMTNFVYEDAMSFSDGLIAVKQNGKWGYINEQGKTVVPFRYDSAWNRRPMWYEHSTTDAAYVPSDGYIAVCKNGKWGYLDTDGNPASDFVFEEARPVYKGMAWVKQNGLWGVIAFDGQTPQPLSDEEIIEKFNEAYEFWEEWIYGHPSIDLETVNLDTGNFILRGAVQHDTIHSSEDLKTAIRSYFSDSLAENFIRQLEPEDKDGSLYINYKDGIGGIIEEIVDYKVTKLSDTEYKLTLVEMYPFEPSETYQHDVFYCFDGEKWGFSNDPEDPYFTE